LEPKQKKKPKEIEKLPANFMMDDFRIRVGAKIILLFINRETQVDWVIDMQYHMLRYFRPQFACIIEYLSPLTFSSLGQVNI